jgi:hypothetical protein
MAMTVVAARQRGRRDEDRKVRLRVVVLCMPMVAPSPPLDAKLVNNTPAIRLSWLG